MAKGLVRVVALCLIFFVDLAISFWVIAATRVRSIISLCISNTHAGNGPIVHFDGINCSLHEGQGVVVRWFRSIK